MLNKTSNTMHVYYEGDVDKMHNDWSC